MKEANHGWIVEVLDDLYHFSTANKLHKLTPAIEQAKMEALNEINDRNTASYDALMSVVFPKRISPK